MKDAYQLAIDSSHPQGPRGKWIKLRQLVADVDVPLATQKRTCTVLGLRIGASLYYSTANKVVLFWGGYRQGFGDRRMDSTYHT